MAYTLHDTLPAYAPAIWEGDQLVNEDAPVLWSGKTVPPAIGAHIKTYLNGLGSGIVVNYFVEDGWLGVGLKLDTMPEWLVKQRRQQRQPADEPVYVFGIDLHPRKPFPTRD